MRSKCHLPWFLLDKHEWLAGFVNQTGKILVDPSIPGVSVYFLAPETTCPFSLNDPMSTSTDLEPRPASFDNDPTKTIVETRNLGKVYRDFWGRKKVQALKSLDLEVRRGEIFGLLGPNGSG